MEELNAIEFDDMPRMPLKLALLGQLNFGLHDRNSTVPDEYYVKFPDPLQTTDPDLGLRLRRDQDTQSEVKRIHHIGPVLRKIASQSAQSPIEGMRSTGLSMVAIDDAPDRQYVMLSHAYPELKQPLPMQRLGSSIAPAFTYRGRCTQGYFTIKSHPFASVESLSRLDSPNQAIQENQNLLGQDSSDKPGDDDKPKPSSDSSDEASGDSTNSDHESSRSRSTAATSVDTSPQSQKSKDSQRLSHCLDQCFVAKLTTTSSESDIERARDFASFHEQVKGKRWDIKCLSPTFRIHPPEIDDSWSNTKVSDEDQAEEDEEQEVLNEEEDNEFNHGTAACDWLKNAWEEVVRPEGYVLVLHPLSEIKPKVILPLAIVTIVEAAGDEAWLLSWNITDDTCCMVYNFTARDMADPDPDGNPPPPHARIGTLDGKRTSVAQVADDGQLTVICSDGFFLTTAVRKEGELCVGD